jgi:CubicO group peptidase (beta-lactamase class C family)
MNRINRFIRATFSLLSFSAIATLSFAQNRVNIEKVDQYLQSRLATSSVSGLAIAIVQGDSLLLAKGYGETATGQPVTATTPFAIASLSKGFTAMAILQLAEAGRLNLDAPVVTYLTNFATADGQGATITIRQLLHQTSGLADTGFPELAYAHQPSTSDEAIAQLKEAKLISKSGQRFHYHNPNYRILAKLVEVVSHERFDQYLQKYLFAPLGMTHTQDHRLTQDFYSGQNPLANGHIYWLGQPIGFREPDWFVDGAAGLTSTAMDMAQWLRVQLNQGRSGNTQLLSSQSVALMQYPPTDGSSRYGMGWFSTSTGDLYHSGILWTYSAEERILTKERLGIVILFNGGINPFVDYHEFLQGVTDILTNQQPAQPTIPDWLYPIGVCAVLLIAAFLSGRLLFRIDAWKRRWQHRSTWRNGLRLFSRLIPFIFLLLFPCLLTLLSGRVLNWERIFLMMPDGVACFALLALVNLVVVLTQLVYLLGHKKIQR